MTAETQDSVFQDELQECFSNLKKHSITYKLGQIHEKAGDEIQNPLHKQFSLILAKIEEILSNNDKKNEEYIKLLSMKSSIIYEKAKILLGEQLLSESKELLQEALSLIKGYAEHPKVAFLHMRIVNHLTYVLSRLGDLETAKELLVSAIEDEGKCKPEVFSTDDLFLNTKKDDKISLIKLNRLTINNMQMLAWIHARLGNTDMNLKLQHDILQKQLDFAEGDVIRWAESCFRLAGMFIAHNDWENARYHLAAAEFILNPLEACLLPNPEIFAMQADLARTWVYYGLQLFEASRKVVVANCLNDLEKEDTDEISGEKSQKVVQPKNKPLLTFQHLKVEIPRVPISVESLHEAKAVFAVMQKWIKRARLYYTLRDYPLQYVNLCLDLSELYRFVAFYEQDIDSEYAVQKKRYDALETLSSILKEVRPNCYVTVNMELTKEIIEVQMELMNLNLKKLCTANQVPRCDIPEENLKSQMNALSVIHDKLENVTSTLNTSKSNEVVPEIKTVKKPDSASNALEEKVSVEKDAESNSQISE